jgi:NitT/TauT family transport system substrate-binding protein
MRIRRWIRAASAVVLFVAVACAPPLASAPTAATVATAQLTKITASYSERVGNYTVLLLAQDQGLFAKHGLEVDLQLIPGSTGMSALLSGQVQIAQIGGSEIVSAEASGSDLVMSGNLGSVLPYVFIVTPDIQTIDDLRGKHIGISTVGGSADIATRLSMHHYGLDPDKDISILAMGSLQNRTAGLQNGAIQGAPANPPDSFVLQRQGFHVLFDVSELGFPAASATIVAQRAWINEHKAAFQAWNDSIVEAIGLAKRNPAVGLPVMKKFLQSEDDELMRQTYDYWMIKVLKQPPALSPDQFTDTVRALAVNNPKVREVDLGRMIDPSYVQNAVGKGLANGQ